jgi:hypothetical protein
MHDEYEVRILRMPNGAPVVKDARASLSGDDTQVSTNTCKYVWLMIKHGNPDTLLDFPVPVSELERIDTDINWVPDNKEQIIREHLRRQRCQAAVPATN